MAEMKFSLSENGYNTDEADRYILRLQEEYRNAVEWGEQEEKKFAELELKCSRLTLELEEKTGSLRERIETLTGKNRELEEELRQKKADDIGKSNGIISSARQKAEEIINSANNAVKELFDETVQKLYLTREETENLKREKENAEKELEALKGEREKLLERLRDSMAILDDSKEKFGNH